MSSAMTPPAKKNTSEVAMYKIPIRLWSTVVIQLAILPDFQSTLAGVTTSHLTATRARSLVDVLPHVGDQRVDLLLRPVVADGRHEPATIPQQLRQPGLLREEGVRVDRRAVVALPLVSVTLCADALPLALAEASLPTAVHECVVRRLVLDERAREHRLVEDAAELGALPAVRSRRVRPVPGVIDPAGNRVRLAAELRDPPAVRDVLGLDVDVRHALDGQVHDVDRAGAVRIDELPVELVRVDADRGRRRGGRGRARDAGELVEDERSGRSYDAHRGPGQ